MDSIMKRTTLAFAAILSLGAASVGSTGAATAANFAKDLTVTTNAAPGVQLAASYRYYRIVPRRFVRIQLRRRGYYRIHNIRLIRRHVRPYRNYYGNYGPRRHTRAVYVATAWKFGRKYRVFVNAYNGRPFRKVRVW